MRLVIVIFITVLQIASGCAQPTFPHMYPYPEAKITLHVVNQDGKPVTDTEIEANFAYCNHNLSKYPDENGYVTFTSPAIIKASFSNRIYRTFRNPTAKDRYYLTRIRKKYENPSKYSKDGKWYPWNPTVEMVLKERINPIPMYARTDSDTFGIRIPRLNEWCGYDMMKADWVEPYGIGEYADIEINHNWNKAYGKAYEGSSLTIRFPDQHAGAYAFQYSVDEAAGVSFFRSPYHADIMKDYVQELSFFSTIEWIEKENGGKVLKISKENNNYMKPGCGYIFRTRTRVDATGNLIAAHYGKIYPDNNVFIRHSSKGESFIYLPYYLNPIENDTNLEFDPNQNLLLDVKKNKERWRYEDLTP